ncbi:helix-turn-helix domain-containing protein [Streptomyces sp. DSM 44915]|uniref:Helix-turn-helix domain-containing protein n=1 Tax=Streptomyces chisholmiae TaxID=3075540 RepID=A0ABU2JYA0_9ACTN|nr:helix-turn-helix domain-containing protein [Streptomyces sp. DSM 44915]MDT0269981.1 helix-turn-helix domain-containing protein [Streptomyces sp. DSM 44915]
MTQDWARLGTMLKRARESRGLQQKFVAKTLKVERGAIYNIEKGAIKKLTGTIHHYAEMVGWTPESLRVVLEGGEPETLDEVERSAARGRPADPGPAEAPQGGLSLLVRKALSEGDLIDSQVQFLQTGKGELRVTIVARAEPGATAAQLDAAGESWAKLRPALARILDEEQGDGR